MPIEDFVVLATELHRGQKDLSGQPYIFHPLRVAETLRAGNRSERHIIAALLHDTIEDTGIDGNYLRIHGVPAMVVQAVEAMTHPKGQPYQEYIDGIIASGNPIAIIVKYEDIKDNFGRLDRLKHEPATQKRLTVKYTEALRKLKMHVDT